MEPKLGKMLILGAIFNCLDPVLTIVAGLSVRDPFLTPFDKKDVSPSHAFCFLVGSETKNGLIFLFFFSSKIDSLFVFTKSTLDGNIWRSTTIYVCMHYTYIVI